MEMLTHLDKNFKNIIHPGKETPNREFENCSFTGCDFSGSNFSGSRFADCTFINCNLSMTRFKQCQLNNLTFKDCKLLGINFHESSDFLFEVNFENCLLDYCSFLRKKMAKTRFTASSLKNADFTECDLTKCSFPDSDLLNAVFVKTILREADLTSAFNFLIDPEQNNLKKARFSLNGLAGLLYKYDIVIE